MVEEEPATEEIAVAEEEPEDIFGAVNLENDKEGSLFSAASDEEKDEEGGRFAALTGAIGDLGTPEMVTILILAVLAVFIIVRRLRERKGTSTVSDKGKSPEPQVVPAPMQNIVDDSRQELKERVAWK